MKRQIIILMVALLSGCAVQRQPVVSSPQTYLSALQTLELNPEKYKSYPKYHDAVLGQMIAWLKQIDNPEQLKALFWDCHAAGHAKPEGPQEQIQWIDPYFESKNLMLYRLAEMQTPEAAKVLVDLWSDPQAGWDAGAAEISNDSVVKCGKIVLPFLKQKMDSGRNAAGLIRLIESGATTGL